MAVPKLTDRSYVVHAVDYSEEVSRWLRAHSTHPDPVATTGRNAWLDEVSIHVCCPACDRTWDAAMPLRAVVRESMADIVQGWLLPFLQRIATTPCFKMTLLAELSEWVTERLAAAGDVGVLYAELLHEAITNHLCAASDVDVVLERLGFVRNWAPGHLYVPTAAVLDQPIDVRMVGSSIVPAGPRIRLPEDHPLHPGNSHNCDLPGLFTTEIEWRD